MLGPPEVPVSRSRPPRSRNRPAAPPDPDGGSGRTVPVERAEAAAERRNQPRGPASNAFVAGLVHELRNFEFGIGGSLDACQACCSGQPGWARYEAVLRASLDRLDRFLDELGDYGAPPAPVWTERSLELLLREAVARLGRGRRRPPASGCCCGGRCPGSGWTSAAWSRPSPTCWSWPWARRGRPGPGDR